MSSGQARALRRRVLLSGTMLVAAVAGYGRRAYGACVNSGGSTYRNVARQWVTAAGAGVVRNSDRSRSRSRCWSLLAAIAISFLSAGAALAQQGGNGGQGDYRLLSGFGAGGAGGTYGNPGSNGVGTLPGINTGGAGGGGGADAAGGNGGNGGFGESPGAGGAAGVVGRNTYGNGLGLGAGQNGGDGTSSLSAAGGGGGGGGATAQVSNTNVVNGGMIVGGNGGNGGNGGIGASNPVAGGGGGGGSGGGGLILSGAGLSVNNSGSILGGSGGIGGSGTSAGDGGDGAIGINAGNGATITNGFGATIAGGNGGAGGTLYHDNLCGNPFDTNSRPCRPGSAGRGGAGISGSNLTIVNSGTIAGGSGPGGNAITFTGGANSLTSSGTLTGNLGLADGAGTTLTVKQTAAAGATGNAIISGGITGVSGAPTDASVIITTGNGYSVTLGGSSNYSGGTSVTDGSTVVLANGSALGSGTLTMGQLIADHTTLVLNGNGLNIANTMVFNSDPVITVATGNTNTMSGNISGAGDVVLNGGGTLVLSGANTYSGGTTLCGTACGIAGGSSTLRVGVDTVGAPGAITSSAIGTGTLTFDGGTLQAGGNYTIANATQVNSTGGTIDSNGFTFTHSGNISDAPANVGGLKIKDSTSTTGIVVLSGNNTYSGATTVASGMLKAGSVTGLSQNSAFMVNTGATLDLNGFSSTIGSLANGAGGGGTVTNNGASDATLTAGGDNSSTAFSGTIKDGATNKLALTKTGTGTMTLSGNNTYTGTTTVDAGTLAAGSATGLSQNSAYAVNSGATLDLNGFSSTIKSLSDGAGGGGIVTNRGTANAALTVGDTSSTSFSGSIQDGPTNTLALVKTGTGTLTLSGQSTYSGGTTLVGGTLNVGANSVFNTPGDPTSGIVSSAIGTGTLAFNGGTLQAGGNFTIANATTIGPNGATIDANSSTFTHAGDISDAGATPGKLNIIGVGGARTVILAGNNTYSGGTTVINAGLQADNNNAIGTGDVTLRNGASFTGASNTSFGNTFKVSGFNSIKTNGTLTLSGAIVDDTSVSAGGVVFFGNGTTILTGNSTYSGSTIVGAGTTLQLGNGGTTGSLATDVIAGSGTLVFNRSDSAATPYVFSTMIWDDGVGTMKVKQTGSGTTVLSSINTYTGGTTISNGTLRVTNSIAGFGSSVGTGRVTLDGGTFQAGANNLNFSNAFAVNTSGGTVDTNGNTLKLSGTIADGNGATGVLTKSGAGTLILTGTNSYSGGTSLTAGTLSINNGSAIGSGDLAMAEGTALKLTGTFTLNNNINIAGDPIFDVTTGNTTTIAGVISDAPSPAPPGVVEKIGAGTLVLSGTNTYSGGTVISAGTLRATNTSSVGSGTVTLDGGTFQADGVTNLAFTNNIKVNTTGGAIDNNGTVLTLSGIISNGNGNTGVLQLTDSTGGSGTTVLAGANTYAGGTRVVGAAVMVTNNNSVGSGTVTLEESLFIADGSNNLTFANNFKINSGAQGSAIDSNGVTLTIAGNISDGNGAGKLTIADNSGGLGTVVLTGVNTYTGGTTICACATLQLGTSATQASIVGAVVNEGSFNIVNANTSGITSITTDGGETSFYNATSANSATLTNKNLGATFFFDSSTAGTATIKNESGGTTNFGILGGTDTSTAGGANIENSNGGTIFAASTNAGTATITNHNNGGTIFADQSSAASATITNSNGGFTLFGMPLGTDTATAGNATIINNSGGMTSFNAFTTAGNATITTNNGGKTVFFDDSTGGNAQFITNGTGFVDFGGSIGLNSDNRITAGSIAGSGKYYIGGGNTLITGSNNLSTTVSGVIADFNSCGCGPAGIGNLEKVGTGTMILSGVNTYTGATTVFGGALQVDGSIASSSQTTVTANTALTGRGTVGNTTIEGGGILLPGSGVAGSSLKVAGNLAFQSGALYLVTLNSTTASFTDVTGTADLAGNVGASALAGSTIKSKYTILTAAGGRNGQFAGLDTSGIPAGLIASLTYDPTHVYLNFALDYAAKFKLNTNQRTVNNTLANFFNANGGIPGAFAGLTQGGLAQISGESATGSQQTTFNAMNQFMGVMTDPFIDGRGDGPGAGGGTSTATGYASTQQPAAVSDAYAMFTKAPSPSQPSPASGGGLGWGQRWSVWAAGYGGSQTTDGNAALGSSTATSRIAGTAVGADYRISPFTIAGFALAGGGTSFSVNGMGSGRSDLFQAGGFIRHTVGPAYLSGALAYGWQDITTDRTVTVAGVDQLRAEFKANAWSGRIEGGYRFVSPWIGGIGITPYAAGQFTTFDLPAYAEQAIAGSNMFALAYGSKSVTAPRSEIGVRTDKSWAMQNAILTLRGRLAWAYDYNTDRSIGATFQTLPGASFVVNGAAPSHDKALTTASAEVKWINGWSVAATFEGEFSDVSRSYAGKGVIRYQW